MSSPTEVPTQQNADQTALACYLSTVVAIGNCMAEVCPSVGTMYRDRLLKLPRRLGFDATPKALEQSRHGALAHLTKYATFARQNSAWLSSDQVGQDEVPVEPHRGQQLLG